MSNEKYLDDMKNIQSLFIEFIDDNENSEEKFQNLILIIEDKKIRDNKHNLRLFLHHVANICANHHREQNFYGKIDRLFHYFKNDLKKYYVNSELFNIFKKNKRILLFLIEEEIINFDRYVAKSIIDEKYVKKKYPQYFAPELKTFISESWFPKYDSDDCNNANEWIEEIEKDLPDDFYELRRIGENESYICKLIREDNVVDFISHVNKINLPLGAQINPSIYETNAFLIKNQNEYDNEKGITLIEYAAFFGSIQIFRYLQIQGEELKPSLWLYVIHSLNAELVQLLEECHIEPTVLNNKRKVEVKSYSECFNESIKCNHNAIADYILSNYLQNDVQMPIETFIQSLKYYNFELIQNKEVKESSLCQLIKYDYYIFVTYLLTMKDIIQNNIFL